VIDHVFLAVPLPTEIKEKLDGFSSKWHHKLPFKKWTYKDDFHITLSFLGPVTYTKSNELMKQLQMELGDYKSFQLSIQGLGIFGSKEQPRVWWCGINNSSELIELQNRIRNVCEEVGFTIEKRPYRPHITIAKKHNEKFSEEFDIPLLWNEDALNFDVNEIVLYKIHPSKNPSYEVVESIKLH
jgi:RNA 2',3'-cyclic 3'-phosphodiesterase